MNQRLSFSKVFRSILTVIPVILFGLLGFVAVTLSVRYIIMITNSTSLFIIVLRFILVGVVVLLWLFIWWKFTSLYRKRILNSKRIEGDDEHGG